MTIEAEQALPPPRTPAYVLAIAGELREQIEAFNVTAERLAVVMAALDVEADVEVGTDDE